MIKVFFTPLRDQTKRLFLYESFFSLDSNSEKFIFKPKTGLHYDFESVSKEDGADVVIESSPITRRSRAGWKPYPVSGGKPYIVQIGGDLSHDIFIDGPIVLKVSQYKKLKKENEIIMPPFCEDVGAIKGITYRAKRGKPVVSFCGWAAFSDIKSYFKYVARLSFIELLKITRFDASLEVFKKGIYFRRKSLRVLQESSLIDTSFIIRGSFSGSTDTISLDPERARREYVDSMIESDFVLAPKGDANYSVRFFEALSVGRIPVLIDTGTCLPFEDKIDYSKFIVRVSYKDIRRLPKILSDLYAALSEEKWRSMQVAARQAFEDYLRYDSYWNALLKDIVR